MAALDRAAIAALDSRGCSRMCSACQASQDALWRVQSAASSRTTRGRSRGRRMGGSAIAPCSRRGARRHGFAADPWRLAATACPVDNATRPCCAQLLGPIPKRHLPATSGRALGAHESSSPRRLSSPSSQPPTGWRDPGSRWLPAPRGARLSLRPRARGSRAVRCRATPDDRNVPRIDLAGSRLARLRRWTRRRGREPRQAASPIACKDVRLIIGAGVTAAVAYRWKTQINENAKAPPSGELPSLTTTRSRLAGRARRRTDERISR